MKAVGSSERTMAAPPPQIPRLPPPVAPYALRAAVPLGIPPAPDAALEEEEVVVVVPLPLEAAGEAARAAEAEREA